MTKPVKQEYPKCKIGWYCPVCNLGDVANNPIAAFADHKKRNGGNCGDQIYLRVIEVKK